MQHYAASGINRSFLVSSPHAVRLCYGTTADIRWESDRLDFSPVQLAANAEFNSMLATDGQGRIHFFFHQGQASGSRFQALVGKIWYEGYDSPKWLWQSVGGTDDYESKLSLMPLVFGTLKGTLYALVFAVPVAVMAAVYTAHFMPPSVKRGGEARDGNHGLPCHPWCWASSERFTWLPEWRTRCRRWSAWLSLIPSLAALIAWFWTTRPAAWRNNSATAWNISS